MKHLFLIALAIITLNSCSKSDDSASGPVTVTYVFSPGGANSQIIYTSLSTKQQINAGYHSANVNFTDIVNPGEMIRLQMSTQGTPVGNYAIRVMANGKEIISKSTFETDGAGTKFIIINQVLPE